MEIKCIILCGECSRWQPDAKRQEGIRFGACGMNGKRTERTTICRMPEASVPIRIKRQYAERKKKERIPGGRITPRTQAAYQLYSEGKNYKEIGEIIGVYAETARDYVRRYIKARKYVLGISQNDNRRPTPVIGENIETGEIIRFNSMADAKRIGGFNDTQISRCCAGRKKQYAGYKWRKDDAGERKETTGI